MAEGSETKTIFGIGVLRWRLKMLHDPKYLIPWEFWYYSILRSCRIFSINSSLGFGVSLWSYMGLTSRI